MSTNIPLSTFHSLSRKSLLLHNCSFFVQSHSESNLTQSRTNVLQFACKFMASQHSKTFFSSRVRFCHKLLDALAAQEEEEKANCTKL